VLLDVTHVPRETLLERLPRMYRQFIDLAMLDITRTPMEVAPTAHYSMGGVVVEPDSHRTDVEGLYAVGECASGLHGANRLGGNSLVEGVVFGRRVGEHAAAYVREVEVALRHRAVIAAAKEEVDAALAGRGDEFARPLQRAVRDAMTEHCGVVRSEQGLAAGLAELDAIEARAADLEVRPDIAGFADLVHAFDLRAMLVSGRATIVAARERRETRGAHNRVDFPGRDDEGGRVNLVLDRDLRIEARPVPEPGGEVAALAGTGEELAVAGRLLE
jgi:succinate dehydrogenase / fumarate reductase flavoprotein subunit